MHLIYTKREIQGLAGHNRKCACLQLTCTLASVPSLDAELYFSHCNVEIILVIISGYLDSQLHSFVVEAKQVLIGYPSILLPQSVLMISEECSPLVAMVILGPTVVFMSTWHLPSGLQLSSAMLGRTGPQIHVVIILYRTQLQKTSRDFSSALVSSKSVPCGSFSQIPQSTLAGSIRF